MKVCINLITFVCNKVELSLYEDLPISKLSEDCKRLSLVKESSLQKNAQKFSILLR